MLTIVDFVLLHKFPKNDFPHQVADILTEFLIQDMTLHQACAFSAFSSTNLQEWVWRRGLRDVESSRWTVAKLVHTNRHYFQWEFVRGMCESVRCGSVEKAQWMLDHFPGCPILESAVDEAARCGRLAVLELFESEQPQRHVEWSSSSMHNAAEAGNWNIVRWLDDRVCTSKSRRNPWILKYAVEQNEVDEVKWLIEGGFDVWITYPCTTEFYGYEEDWENCSEIIRYLLEGGHGDRDYILQGAIIEAVEIGDLEFTKWLVTQRLIATDDKSCHTFSTDDFFALEKASFYGHLHLVKWLLEQMESSKDIFRAPATAMRSAAKGGELEVVQWLYNKYSDNSSINLFGTPQFCTGRDTIMDIAAKHGHLDVLVYLHNIATEARDQDNEKLYERLCCTNEAIDGAAANGHLEVIKWLHDNLSAGCSTKAMDSVATKIFHVKGGSHYINQPSCCRGKEPNSFFEGQRAILEYLKENYDVGRTTKAMDGAATNGNLKMLQWLHENTNAGCTTNAMDSAATEGYLDVVTWLHENRSEGCSSSAMENAAQNGHLNVVKWLCENRSEGDLLACLRGAVSGYYSKDNLPMVRWVLSKCSKVKLWPLIWEALKKRRFEIALYLHSHIGGEDCDEKLNPKSEVNDWRESQYMRSWLEEVSASDLVE